MIQAIVIGGGAVGLAIANALLNRGVQVRLVNAPRGETCASWGNAGHIAIEQVVPLASASTILSTPRRLLSPRGGLSLPIASIGAWAPFSWKLMQAAMPERYAAGKKALTALLSEAGPAWERLAQSLGKPQLLRREGHFITWSTAKAAAAGRAHWLSTEVGTASIRDAAADELSRLRSLAPQIAGAVRCVGSGQISDPDELRKAMEMRLLADGRLISAGAVAVESEPGGVRLDNGQVIQSDIIIVAAGIGSRALLEGLGLCVPMIAERGYHIQYEPEGWPAGTPPVVFEDYAMIATRFDSLVRVAGFVEFSRADLPADPKKWQRLTRNVKDLGLPLTRRISAWMGSRPTLPDYLPAIGRSRRASNLFYAFGHQHLGLTLAPLTGELMAAVVMGETPAIHLEPFDLERFER
ncbi:MAG: FAD-binding oxidoreductase [Alphaproteobacteria bacterium]|nr:FAD-binding oxidoreductase [Alphaproteobacteria bacterium]